MYLINVKTAEPIRSKFCAGPHVAPGKVNKWSKFQIFVFIKIRFSLNFWKFRKSTNFFVKICELFYVLFYDVHKENMFTIERKDGCKSPVYIYIWLVWVSVCLFVSNKRQNGWTDPAQIFCGTSRDPREGLWMIEI